MAEKQERKARCGWRRRAPRCPHAAPRAGTWGRGPACCWQPHSDVLPAVGAQDVVPLGEEAAAHQRQGAPLAVEAVIVPLPLLEGDVLCAAKSCGRRMTG